MSSIARRSIVLVVGVAVSLGLVAPPAHAAGRPAAPAVAGPSVELPAPPTADWASRRAEATERFGLEPSPAVAAVQRAIDPTEHACAPTEFDAYIDGLLAGLTDDELEFLLTSGVLDFPALDALVFGTSDDPQYALGRDATHLRHTYRDLARFWDIDSADIQLLAMRGEMLLDADRVARVLVVVHGLTPAEAAGYAEVVSSVVSTVPAFAGGAYPMFTLNAFAFSGEGYPDPFVASLPDSIVVGQGLLEAMDTLGLGDVGPRVILAHEFGHHIQFELGLFDSPLTGAEATRRTELMADAYATYHAVHARGLALNAKRVSDALQSFHAVGDCQFEHPNHHGTPLQRERAAAWAASLASSARPQGSILPAATFAGLFEQQLPGLVAPDA